MTRRRPSPHAKLHDRAYSARRRVALGTERKGDRDFLASYQAQRKRPIYARSGASHEYSIDEVLGAVRSRMGIDLGQHTDKGRSGPGVELARGVAMIICRDLGYTLLAIGKAIGRCESLVRNTVCRGRKRPDTMLHVADVKAQLGRRAAKQHKTYRDIAEILRPFEGKVSEHVMYKMRHAIAALVFGPVPSPERAAPAAGEPYEIRGVVGDEVWRLIDRWAEAQELGGATSSGLSKPPSLRRTE